MSTELVQSVQRAFAILQAVGENDYGISLSAIAEKTGLHMSTASRLVTTLETVNALARVDGGSQLVLGEGLVALVNRAPWTERMISLARPYLRELADATRESVGLTQLHGDECHVYFQIESPHHVRIRDWAGYRFPLHVTSSGKLWMADWSTTRLKAYFSIARKQVTPQTAHTLEAMRAEFENIRSAGFAWTIDELEEGLTSLAVPIQQLEKNQPAAIYLSAPSFRFPRPSDKEKLAQSMLDTAKKINKAITDQQR